MESAVVVVCCLLRVPIGASSGDVSHFITEPTPIALCLGGLCGRAHTPTLTIETFLADSLCPRRVPRRSSRRSLRGPSGRNTISRASSDLRSPISSWKRTHQPYLAEVFSVKEVTCARRAQLVLLYTIQIQSSTTRGLKDTRPNGLLAISRLKCGTWPQGSTGIPEPQSDMGATALLSQVSVRESAQNLQSR